MTGKGIDLRKYIRDIPDWPEEGILFRDITPLLADTEAFAAAVEALSAGFVDAGIEYVAAVEARGFIFGSAVAEKIGAGFVPIRKLGKLPWKTESITYDLEYGTDTLEVHRDAFESGGRVAGVSPAVRGRTTLGTAGEHKGKAKVLMVDDLLATGGTMSAACRLVEQTGGKVAGIVFLIELAALRGREKISDYETMSIISFD